MRPGQDGGYRNVVFSVLAVWNNGKSDVTCNISGNYIISGTNDGRRIFCFGSDYNSIISANDVIRLFPRLCCNGRTMGFLGLLKEQ